MIFNKIQVNLHLPNAPEEIDPKYYALLGAIFDLMENNPQLESQILTISPLIQEDKENFKFYISYINTPLTNLLLTKLLSGAVLNIDTLPFKTKSVSLTKSFDVENFQPSSNFRKVLMTFQSPTCFSTPQKKPFMDIQPFTIYKSINNKLLKLWININLNLFQLEKNSRLIWIKNLNSSKVWIKKVFKIWFTGKLFFELSWDEKFKQQIHYLTEVVEFVWVGLNPRLGMWNAYWKLLKSALQT